MQPLTRSRPRPRFFGTSGPSFALDFVNGTNALDPRVTFTRASSATYFDSAGVLQSAAIDVPRLDYNPATLAAQGLLIEEARTNSIRNNTMQGAVAGTPGTAPTNWFAATTSNGLSREIVGTGTENGITYVDIRYSGTTSAASLTAIYWETATQVAALINQVWTNSVYVSLVGGSTANIIFVVVGIDENNSGGNFLAGGNTAFTPSAGALNGKRYFHTRTLTNASTAFAWPYVFFSYGTGAAIDITLRIGLPQLELGAFATSVIPTTTTALTRSADVASVTTLSPWYNASEGTIYAEVGSAPLNTIAQQAWYLSDGSSNNAMFLRRNTVGLASAAVSVLGATQGDITSGAAITGGASYKAAFAYATNDLAISVNGNPVGTDTTASIPTVDRIALGSSVASTQFVNGYIRRITYYPRRLSNAELQAITA